MAMLLLLLLPMALGQTTLEGTEVKVTTVTHRPFIMPNNLSSGERYEGFLVDMLKELSTMLGFTFTIHDNPDGKYGQNVGGTWNGMIGEMISGTADIALADMTITSKREEAVDFTHPFLNVGLGVLGYRGAAAPRSLQQLADDDSLKVGAFCCGSTAAAFRDSVDPLYQKIWAKMQEDPENMMTNSNEDGVDKVLASRGTYVYIMESGSIDYEVARNCRLTQAGKTFWSRSYGLALAPGSPYRKELNKGILMMQESGRMEMLVKRWIGLEGSVCAAQQAGLIGWLSSML
jgi:ABC-type amino acid transport substrate-binding protein